MLQNINCYKIMLFKIPHAFLKLAIIMNRVLLLYQKGPRIPLNPYVSFVIPNCSLKESKRSHYSSELPLTLPPNGLLPTIILKNMFKFYA